MRKFAGLVFALGFSLSVAACGGNASPESVCKKMGELAEEAGGEAKERWEKRSDDCVEEVKKAKKELGDEKFKKFADCVNNADGFEKAWKDCDPNDFE